ncbi:MAG: hypothetical protein ACFB22_05875 [Rhodothalassiaceae bacterium]
MAIGETPSVAPVSERLRRPDPEDKRRDRKQSREERHGHDDEPAVDLALSEEARARLDAEAPSGTQEGEGDTPDQGGFNQTA